MPQCWSPSAAFVAFMEKFRLARQFFASLRKRGVRRTLRMSFFEIYYEYKLGANTSYIISTRHLDGDPDALSHASDYFPSSYLVLHEAFSELRANCRGAVLVDYGSGMGRTLMFASAFPLKRMVGVEISQSLCAAAAANLERLYAKGESARPPWSIVNADARFFAVPDDANLFYFFNPFDAAVMAQVVENIVNSARNAPRTCVVVYANPVHETELTVRGFLKRQGPATDFSVFVFEAGHKEFVAAREP